MKRTDINKKNVIQIIFFINRNLSWSINDRNENISIKKGQTCIYADNFNETTCMYQREKKFLFKNLQISKEYFNNILLNSLDESQIYKIEQKMNDMVTKLNINGYMYNILDDIDNSYKYNKNIRKIYLEGKVLELLSIYLQEVTQSENFMYSAIRDISREDIEAIKKSKEIIDSNIGTNFTCEELAKNVTMSLSKFTKCFNKIYGKSVHKYVIEARLSNAAQLLSRDNINVTEAAILSGYNNMSHFSKSFKKKYGVLPRDFKN